KSDAPRREPYLSDVFLCVAELWHWALLRFEAHKFPEACERLAVERFDDWGGALWNILWLVRGSTGAMVFAEEVYVRK
ncbi:MAG: hypothetical protein WC843_04665, partial [Candidatus Gracilibacteria bacterium]